MSLRTPLEVAFGGYLGRFYSQLIADTPAMAEYVKRGLAKSISWVPGRMIDGVEDMLSEWRKNDNSGGPGESSFLPVMLVAMSKDFVTALPDWGVALGTPVDFVIPEDPEQRAYKIRLSMNEYRCQIVIIAAEVHTAHSLAMQLNLYANGPDGRRFKHIHMHAGFPLEFPAVLENIDIGAMDNKSEQKNLTVLVAEINLRAAIPLIQAPRADEPNDGGTAPAGYPVVMEVNSFDAVSLNKIRTYVDGDEIKTEFSR